MSRHRNWLIGLAIAVVSALGVAGIVRLPVDDDTKPSDKSEESTPTTEEESEDEDEGSTEECPTWTIDEIDDEDTNRVMADGFAAIREAETDEEARAAVNVYVFEIRKDPELFSGNMKFFLEPEEVLPPDEIFDDEGCATPAAEVMYTQLSIVLAQSAITPDDAPTTPTNSGVDEDGNVIVAEVPGISGDLAAVMIELPDGTKIWILARCGNIVSENPPPDLPPGVTDEPPPEEPPTTPPPTAPPPTTPPPPGKCWTYVNGVAVEVQGSDPDGDGYCGTPDDGPDVLDPTEDPPPADTGIDEPTPGADPDPPPLPEDEDVTDEEEDAVSDPDDPPEDDDDPPAPPPEDDEDPPPPPLPCFPFCAASDTTTTASDEASTEVSTTGNSSSELNPLGESPL